MRPVSSDGERGSLDYDHSNDKDNNLEDLFDPRPVIHEEAKTSTFRKIYNSIADSFVCKKLTDFFGWIGGGVLAAADHVVAAFGRRQIAGEMVAKNIKDNVQLSPSRSVDVSQVDQKNHATYSAGFINSSQNNLSGATADQSSISHAESDSVVEDNSVSVAPIDNSQYEAKADEQAFGVWLNSYKNLGDRAVCQQNFEARAKSVAQKIYDAESDRYAQAKQQDDTYWLSKDDQIRLKAAAALLKKNLPYSDKSSASEIGDPPTYHPDHQHNFSVWRTWIEKKEWPDRGLPDLKPALIYAKDFIRSHAESPDKHDDKTKSELAAAFQLVAFENDYALEKINSSAAPIMRELLMTAEDSAEAQPAFPHEPPLPPPRRSKVDYGPPPPPPSPRVTADSAKTAEILSPLRVTSLPDFPNDAKSLQLLPIQATYTVVELRTIIINAKTYFEALKEDRQFSVESKAGAITLANLWKLAKSDGVKMAKLEQLEFFNDLDQLLQPEKIEKDFK